ncbi:MAG: ATP-binding protein [Planctomycetota bacterium]|nr:ATP-binding protein [Planctomycetota bacterium]
MKTIRAKVNRRLLEKADRLFTGTLAGRVIEILQNARRAGATQVDITNEEGWVTVRDNGKGIEDFSKVLDMGGSDWGEDVERSEDPAGVGLFCLAPRMAAIRSRGKFVTINEAGWTGDQVEVREDPAPVAGTVLRFKDEPWSFETVEMNAVFSGLNVTVDGKACDQAPFVSAKAIEHPELGCRIDVLEGGCLGRWHDSWRRALGYDNVLVNFHGQVVAFQYRPVEEHHLYLMVDMTGAPTGIRLMLPARTRLVENAAFEALKAALELDVFRYFQRKGEHTLYSKDWLRAKELGVELPEATPTFGVGLLDGDMPEPVEVRMPKEFPLAACYRLNPNLNERDEKNATNTHLLGGLGRCDPPFVPVSVDSGYDGYGWAKLPTADKVEVAPGKVLHEEPLWMQKLVCVDSLAITVRTSDGKTFSSPVCMAVLPPEGGKGCWMDLDRVHVTPEARKRLSDSEIWRHLGGWYEDGDTYDTQDANFQKELEAFWANLVGPDEHLRIRVMETLRDIGRTWEAVSVGAEGRIKVRFADGSEKIIQPPAAEPQAA